MVKPVTIKLEERVWRKFKNLSKNQGVRLDVAVDRIFRKAIAPAGNSEAVQTVPSATVDEANT